MQALVRNALADPFVLGVSSGASVGAVAVTVSGGLAAAGMYAVSAGAFLGALGATALVFLASVGRAGLTPLRLVLTGVVLSFGFPGRDGDDRVLLPRRRGHRDPAVLVDGRLRRGHLGPRCRQTSDIIASAGGRNIFGDRDARWTQVSWEAVVEGRPEVIIVLDYNDQPAAEKIAFLKSFPSTRELPAVVNDRFFVLHYNEGISGPRNIDGLEKFAEYLRTL